jgi:hypothetical protein
LKNFHSTVDDYSFMKQTVMVVGDLPTFQYSVLFPFTGRYKNIYYFEYLTALCGERIPCVMQKIIAANYDSSTTLKMKIASYSVMSVTRY